MKLDNKNIFVSVSAGYSSVMMAVMMKEWYPDHNIVYGMANPSKERPESLGFMQQAADHFGFDLVWIEAVINEEKGKGTDYKIVEYQDLDRKGEIYEKGIKTYGIPSVINKWCNRELKLIPMTKFCNDYFGRGNYSVAIGIRADEIDRVSKDYKTNNIFYPLVDHKLGTRDRNKFWENQPVKLKIKAYEGNCDMCFEKSNRKLMTIYKENPQLTDWWVDMFDKYGKIKIDGKDSYNDFIDDYGYNNFLRKNITFKELIEMAERPFNKATDEYIYESDLFDQEDECGAGCVIWK